MKIAIERLNRKTALHNIKILCPELATYIHNCYSRPARLFINGGGEISSNEGTTQGDPVAMSMYAIGLTPLLTTLETNKILQVAFADDITGAGKLRVLKIWWDAIIKHGPLLGYFVEESKSWLIVKEENSEIERELFKSSPIKITTSGRRHLGTIISDEPTKDAFMKKKVNEWVSELHLLQDIAKTQPHLAFAAFIHGLRHRIKCRVSHRVNAKFN